MNKRGGLIVALLAGWGVMQLMGPGGSTNRQRMKARAERLRGRIEQAVGGATGSKSTHARGELDEAKGMGREKVADVESAIDELAG